MDVTQDVSPGYRGLALDLLDEHLGRCLVHASEAGGQDQDIKLNEASDALARLVRS